MPGATASPVLVRVGSMIGQLLEEIRIGSLDARSHARLGDTLARAISEVRSVVDRELCRELDVFAPAPDPRGPLSEPELRVCHAQLVGWIAGVVGMADETGIPEPP